MKGIVVNCLEKLVSENFGTEKWNEIRCYTNQSFLSLISKTMESHAD